MGLDHDAMEIAQQDYEGMKNIINERMLALRHLYSQDYAALVSVDAVQKANDLALSDANACDYFSLLLDFGTAIHAADAVTDSRIYDYKGDFDQEAMVNAIASVEAIKLQLARAVVTRLQTGCACVPSKPLPRKLPY